MASTLALIRRCDGSTDIETISLISYTNGCELAVNGWSQKSMRYEDHSVIEVITLRVNGTSQDNVAANLQAIDKLIRKAREYIASPADIYSLWLRDKKITETTARQALIYDISGQINDTLGGPIFDNKFWVQNYTLTIERGHWESKDIVNDNVFLGMSGIGGMHATSAAVPGDYAARLCDVTFYGHDGGGGPLTRFWMGFRSPRYGTAANFVPVWECELGTLANNTATTTDNDATASGSTPKSIRVTIASSPTMLPRCTLSVAQVAAAHPDDQRGNFLVLLRAQLSAAGTVNVRLSTGFTGVSAWSAQDRVNVTGTSWNIYELGTVQIPETGRTIFGYSPISAQAIRIEAECTSGTPTLDMDCLILIPYDEGYVYSSGGSVQYVGADAQPVHVENKEDGGQLAVGYTGGLAIYNDVECHIIGGLPVGITNMVLAAARASTSVLADHVDVNLQFLPRWATLRGAT